MELLNSSEGPIVVMSIEEACDRLARVYHQEPQRTVTDVFDLTYQLAIADPEFRNAPAVSLTEAAVPSPVDHSTDGPTSESSSEDAAPSADHSSLGGSNESGFNFDDAIGGDGDGGIEPDE